MIDTKTAHIGQASIVEIKGRVDSMNVAALEKVLDREGAPGRRLLLEMAGVTYMSAAGLRVLHNLHVKNGGLHILNPSDRVREVLQITGLDAMYKIHTSQINALHAVSPVTNAHTHLEQGWLADQCPPVTGVNFLQWVKEMQQRLQAASMEEKEIVQAVERGIWQLIDRGTTAVADITATGHSIGPLLQSGLRGVAYVELRGTQPEKADDALESVRKIIETWRPQENGRMRVGLALHAPYALHPALWEKALAYARSENLPVAIHIAETAAEHEYMTRGTGPLTEYYSSWTAVPSPRRSPVGFLDESGALALKPLLIHAVYVDTEDVRRIRRYGCAVVHCPRSNLRLRSERMPLEKFLVAGIPVLLGTDSLASTPSLDVFEEVEVAVALHHGVVPPEQILAMVGNSLPEAAAQPS